MHKHPNEERIAALYDHFAKGEFDAMVFSPIGKNGLVTKRYLRQPGRRRSSGVNQPLSRATYV
jgi:hypothetical protein